MFRISFVVVSILVLPWVSRANIFLEPYVGLSQYVVSQENTSSSFTSKDVAKSYHLGVRGGFLFLKKYFIAAEYFRGGPYSFTDQFNGNTSSESTNILLGASLGAEFGLVRFSGAYFPDVDSVFTGNSSSNTLIGTGFRVGLGLAVGKKIRANFDMFFQTLNKQELSDGSESDLTTDILGETVAVSVSFPFEFK